MSGLPEPRVRFDYGHYLNSVQDAESVRKNLTAFVSFFDGCKRVLDLGCGTGQFLKLLLDSGIEATGVDEDALAVQQAETSGLRVIQNDVLKYLSETDEDFDGVFCSHLVEHLPFESLVELVEGIARVLKPGGIVVMAFPNPESLDMQLFHFWLDPQHVRFYHPTLLEAMLRHYGIAVEKRLFRNWRTKESWMHSNGSSQSNQIGTNGGIVRKIGKRLKQTLGITRLEDEVDYLVRLKKIGEEAVIIGRKS